MTFAESSPTSCCNFCNRCPWSTCPIVALILYSQSPHSCCTSCLSVSYASVKSSFTLKATIFLSLYTLPSTYGRRLVNCLLVPAVASRTSRLFRRLPFFVIFLNYSPGFNTLLGVQPHVLHFGIPSTSRTYLLPDVSPQPPSLGPF